MSTYAVGDIQGCYASLRRLLDACAFDPQVDCLWLTGDLVNRGPHSLATLRFVRGLGESALTVLGNHDLYLLMLAYGKPARRSKGDTLQEILEADDCEDLLTWLRWQPLCHVAGNDCLVHAGLLPQWSVAQALVLAAEVESALRGPDYREFLGHLWGSEPAAWTDDLQGWARLRCIVNAMTRLRFCMAAGEMEFHSKGETTSAPPGYLPWFAVPGRQSADYRLVTGHWSALGLRRAENHLALDTGCLWGRQLTAVCLEDGRLFQVDCAPGEVAGAQVTIRC